MTEEKVVATDSRNISSYAYSPVRSVLTIEFKSGATWEYENVPDKIFEEMKTADSKGSFFSRRVKGYYNGRRIDK